MNRDTSAHHCFGITFNEWTRRMGDFYNNGKKCLVCDKQAYGMYVLCKKHIIHYYEWLDEDWGREMLKEIRNECKVRATVIV